MIINKINKFLEENNTTIAELAKSTGISRSTLYNLTSDSSKGIQYDTLNKMCMYFDTEICSLIDFVPFDIEVITSSHNTEKNTIKVNNNDKEYNFDISKLAENLKLKTKTIKSNLELTVKYLSDEKKINIELITNIDKASNGVNVTPIYKDRDDNTFIVELQEEYDLEYYIEKTLKNFLLNDESYKNIVKEIFNKDITQDNVTLKWEWFYIQCELKLY